MNKKIVLGCTIIIIATCMAYFPAVLGGYVWDDDDYVLENPLLSAPDGLYRIWFSTDTPSQYFPLTYTSFRLEWSLWGNNPLGYHIINVLLHIGNALLVWLLLRKLALPFAWLAAAIFALHPVQVESVAWITERKNVLSTLFYLLTLWSWLKCIPGKTGHKTRYYYVALFFYALALFAKTTACTLPAILVLILWIQRKKVYFKDYLLILPFLAMGIGMGLVTVWWETNVQGAHAALLNLSFVEKLLIASRAFWFYLGKLLWPFPLIFSYPRWEMSTYDILNYRWLLGIGALIIVLFWCWKHGRRWPALSTLFFVAVLSPLLGFIKLSTFRYSYVADHYQYLACLSPIIVFSAAVGWLGKRFLTWLPLRHILTALLLFVLGFLTWRQCHIYESEETCWRDTIAKNPSSLLAYNNLGVILSRRNEPHEAIQMYRNALRINPQDNVAHYNIAHAFMMTGEYRGAMKHYLESIRINPFIPAVYNDMGIALANNGDVENAIEYFKKALQLDKDYFDACYNLGFSLVNQKRFAEAETYLKRALQLNPGHEPTRYCLATIQSQ